jgi:hypothetical protein
MQGEMVKAFKSEQPTESKEKSFDLQTRQRVRHTKNEG